jgi:hypothetical protein
MIKKLLISGLMVLSFNAYSYDWVPLFSNDERLPLIESTLYDSSSFEKGSDYVDVLIVHNFKHPRTAQLLQYRSEIQKIRFLCSDEVIFLSSVAFSGLNGDGKKIASDSTPSEHIKITSETFNKLNEITKNYCRP